MLLRLIIATSLVSVVLSCGSSGSCGCSSCGCRAKAKARAAKTSAVNGAEFDEKDDGNIFGLSLWNQTELPSGKEEQMRYTNPNFLFHSCCEERRLPAACVKHCHFNTFDRSVLQSMFVGSDRCPMEFLPEMQFCAAQGMDHRRCCTSREVHRTGAGGKCLTFCDQRPDLYTPIDYSYAPCFERFEDMKRCFYDNVRVQAEKKFGPLMTAGDENAPLETAAIGNF